MSGFRKMPSLAWDVCDTPEKFWCYSRLIRHANQRGWAPFEASESFLMSMFGVPQNTVRSLVKVWIDAGLLVVVDPGGNRRSRVVQIIDPGLPDRSPERLPDRSPKTDKVEPEHVSHICPTAHPSAYPTATHKVLEKEKEKEKEKNIHIDELNEKWLSLFGKLRAPTKEGIEKTFKAIGKEKTSLLIDWLVSNHPRARLLRGETGEENRLHSATPWRPSHRTEYLSFAEEESESPTLRQRLPPTAVRPEDETMVVVKRILALPDPQTGPILEALEHFPGWRAYAELADGSIGELRRQLMSPFERKRAEDKIRDHLSKQST